MMGRSFDQSKEVSFMKQVPVERPTMKKIEIRKAGPVRLTAAMCSHYPGRL
jgi:hypothetical protein